MQEKLEEVVEKTTDEITKVKISTPQNDPGDENVVKVDLSAPPKDKKEKEIEAEDKN